MIERKQNGILNYRFFLLGDMLAIVLAQVMAYFVRRQEIRAYIDPNPIFSIFVVLILDFLVVFFGQRYENVDGRGLLRESIATMRLTMQIVFIGLSILFIFKLSESYSRIYLSTWFVLANVFMLLIRLANKTVRKRTGRGIRKKDGILVMASFSQSLFREFAEYSDIAAVYCENDFAIPDGVAKLNTPEELLKYATNHVVDEVFIMDLRMSESMKGFIEQISDMGIAVHFNIEETFHGLENLRMNRIAGRNYVSMSINTIGEKDIIAKRLFDIALSLIGIAFSIPILLIVAPIVVLTDKGSLFFKQKRVGQNGRIFYMYKIRSMYMDAEVRKAELMDKNEMQGHMFKIENDPRITPIGKFIRKTSIDELPQFWNVLKGEMSLVGTRPPTVDEYEQYEPWHKARLALKPGITGMWQVSGRNAITDFEEIVKLDKEYIRNWSLTLDIKILFKTVGVVLKRKGSR